MNKYIVSVLTEDMAKEICTWEYEGEYSVYNFSSWEEVVRSGWNLSVKEERERDLHSWGRIEAFAVRTGIR